MIIFSSILAVIAAITGVWTIVEMIKYCIYILKQLDDNDFYGDDTE